MFAVVKALFPYLPGTALGRFPTYFPLSLYDGFISWGSQSPADEVKFLEKVEVSSKWLKVQ